jgi:hypothetical protein
MSGSGDQVLLVSKGIKNEQLQTGQAPIGRRVHDRALALPDSL